MADVSTAQHRAALHQRALPGRYSGSQEGEGVRTMWQIFLQLPLEAVLRVVDTGNVYSLFGPGGSVYERTTFITGTRRRALHELPR